MIQIRVVAEQQHIIRMTLSGHAGSAEAGQDLVCAGVSAIAFGTCNALEEMGQKASISIEDNCIDICIAKPTAKSDTILKTMLIQLETIRETNRKFVRIRKIGGTII